MPCVKLVAQNSEEDDFLKASDDYGIYQRARCLGCNYEQAMGLVDFVRHAKVGDKYETGGLTAVVGDD